MNHIIMVIIDFLFRSLSWTFFLTFLHSDYLKLNDALVLWIKKNHIHLYI